MLCSSFVLFFHMFHARLSPISPELTGLLTTRKAEREAAWLRRSTLWPVEDLRETQDVANTGHPFPAALDPLELRSEYLREREALLSADRVSDLCEELHRLSPDILSDEQVQLALRRYHSEVAKARRLLARPILSSWHFDPVPGGMENCTFQQFWAFGDFERLLICRTVSPCGLTSDTAFFAERLPWANTPTLRAIYFCRFDEDKGKMVFAHEQVRISAYATTDPDAPPNPRSTVRFLFSCPLVKPVHPAPGRVLSPCSDSFVYSGHQSSFFFAGYNATLRCELANLPLHDHERARKRIRLPPDLPAQCPVCLENGSFDYVIYAYCGHAVCCAGCMVDFFGLDRRRSLQAHRCVVCRAPFPADFASKALDLEQARTSHVLDRATILRRHAKWNALETTLLGYWQGQLLPPDLTEVHDMDVEDERERIRLHMGLSTLASSNLWALCTAELEHLCVHLRAVNGTAWGLVEAYLGFNDADFFRLDYSTYGREPNYQGDSMLQTWVDAVNTHFAAP